MVKLLGSGNNNSLDLDLFITRPLGLEHIRFCNCSFFCQPSLYY